MTDGSQVHAKAKRVLDFWFGLTPERHWDKDAALDAEITDRFGDLRDRVLADEAEDWKLHPDSLLAAIILLDQFSRNIYRGKAEAFAGDALAAKLTLLAIDRDWDERYPPERRVFLYIPLMHAEDEPLQDLSVHKYEALGLQQQIDFAKAHRDVILRFGRFPGRNAALGRESTSMEKEYLATTSDNW